MSFLLCNILIVFSLFFDLSSLTFCTTPWFLCLNNPIYAYIYAGCVLNFSRFTSIVGFFSQKRRLVFHKTTGRFLQSDVLFSSKRRVVFIKTTLHVLMWRNQSVQCKSKARISKCENTYVNPLSRTHAYTRITGVFLFLLSQVSHCNW